jgi:hypothetical protein
MNWCQIYFEKIMIVAEFLFVNKVLKLSKFIVSLLF